MANNDGKNICMNCEDYFCDGIECVIRERLGYALKLAEIGLWEWDLKTNMVQFGTEAMNILGLEKKGNVFSMSYVVNKIVHVDSRPALVVALGNFKEDGLLSNNNYAVTQADGSIKWMQIKGIVFYDAKENPISVKGVIKDVTQEYKRAVKLGEDLSFIETLVELIPDPLFYKDKGGRYKYFNKAFLEFLGMSYDEIFNKTVFEIAPEELARVYDKADKSLMASKGNQKYEANVKYADDSIRAVDFSKTVYLNQMGEVDGILGLMHDITKQKQEEAKKQLVDRMKEMILKLNNKITLYADEDEFFEDVLISCQELFGKSKLSAILEIDDQGMVRAITSQGYDKEDIMKFQIKVEKTFIYAENKGRLDSVCIINDLHRYYHVVVNTTNAHGEDQSIQSSLEIPIVIDDTVRYIISIDSFQNHVFDESDLFVGDYIRTQFQILYRVFNLYQSTLYMSRYDAMTGLMNRHYTDQRLSEAMDFTNNGGEKFFVVLYDLDGLKQINDTYGHHVGDDYIIRFSQYLKDNFLERDSVGRIGGDEFIGMITDMNRDTIVEKIEAIRTKFMAEKFETDKGVVTGAFSYGLQVYDGSIHSLKQLIKSADEEMYKYKQRYRITSI